MVALAAALLAAFAQVRTDRDAVALKRVLDDAVAAHPKIAKLASYGKSRAGRDLWCVELGPVGKADRERLPAMLVVAGLDGNHVVGTEIVLDHLQRLVDGYGSDAAVTKLLDEHVVWLLPRANPDGAEIFFHPPDGAKREVRGNLHPVDDDRDGQLDEDGPQDLDHDGVITQMRWEDPAGTWTEDPTDPRAIKVADANKGERGRWKVAVESLDRDGDGECGEDGPGDVAPNRNFPQRFAELDPTAGRLPMDEPESLALGQFLLARPQIAIAVVYGLQDNIAVDAKPDSGNEQPQTFGSFRFFRSMPGGIVKDDQPLYAELAKRYRETTGVTSKPLIESDDGAFFQFSYFQFGIPTMAMHVWSPPLDVKKPDAAPQESKPAEGATPPEAAKPDEPAPAADAAKSQDSGKPGDAAKSAKPDKPEKKDEPSTDSKLLIWNDVTMAGAAFVPWTKVQHPTLGEVEVGGWKPYVRVNPPDEGVAELAKKHSDFLIELGGKFARARIEEPKIEDLGGGLFRVTTAVVNEGYLPTVCSMGERDRRPRPTRLDLDLRGAKLVQGDARHTWTRIEGSGGRREVKWLLQAEPGREITLHLWSERAGEDERVLALR